MTLDPHRQTIRDRHLAPEDEVLDALARTAPDTSLRQRAARRAAELVRRIRSDTRPGLMEVFLAEYGLSTQEGVALMCLAEALLRVPDTLTIDALIEDKIAPSSWSAHLGHSSSPLVNASTWGLMLTGRVLRDDGEHVSSTLHNLVRRMGEPVIRAAVGRAMKEMGRQFVLGETIDDALRRGRAQERRGYTFSYDMLGEAAMTAADAEAFRASYAHAIDRLAKSGRGNDVRTNPGISVKLSALHPRYETAQRARMMEELVPRVRDLARAAAKAGMGFNIDAEEADRLDLSLDVIEAVLADPELAGWDGFGVVVQAYGKRAGPVIDWLYALAEKLDRRLMVRLVKGAYWDTEVKLAQQEGLEGFPVFTRKPATDVSYICLAAKLLGMTDRLYPQFATHNAQTVAAILEMGADPALYEFQRLHGMGEALHDLVLDGSGTRCRIYAPVGAHRDLLAYLVRRLLENGANSSFVNQIVDASIPPERVAADPFEALERSRTNRAVLPPADLYEPERRNSRGWDLATPGGIAAYDAARSPFRDARWRAEPTGAAAARALPAQEVRAPADPDDVVGEVAFAAPEAVEAAFEAATVWEVPPAERARVLVRASDLYEARSGEFFAVLAREAGKIPADAVAELREAVDFLRYYAARGAELWGRPRGRIVAISPWNFPLAIFTGQIAGALAAGNAVLAKPAETTTLTAALATRLLHEAGVPQTALQLLPGEGRTLGAALVSDPRVDGVVFTGSTATAKAIDRAMAEHASPAAPLVAETGGINAMIVDSTALPEQAVRDIVTSAFQSAGQRCSALRMLYVQRDVTDRTLAMLHGAMDELQIGDPWSFETDIGPVITEEAQRGIARHVSEAREEGRVLKELATPETGYFAPPVVIGVNGIADLEREVFGPVLHVASFEAGEIDRVVDAINATGYGLTFAMHSRIDDRIDQVLARLHVGNAYVNRNQIGAIVGSQPFGGEGLSGTGPKAGGPSYVPRFEARPRLVFGPDKEATEADIGRVQALIRQAAALPERPLDRREMPGPTGESNRLSQFGRGVVLCLGPTAARAAQQARAAEDQGCAAVRVVPGAGGPMAVDGWLSRDSLTTLEGIAAVICEAEDDDLRAVRRALAARDGAIVPLVAETDMAPRCRIERHLSIDTTSAGGNAALLAAADSA